MYIEIHPLYPTKTATKSIYNKFILKDFDVLNIMYNISDDLVHEN